MIKKIHFLTVVPLLALVLLAGAFVLTASAAIPTTSLVAHWQFDGNANDSAGTNNGTLVNGPTFTTGKIGQALKFDGVDDYVDIGSPSIFDDLGPVTYSAWIFARSRGNSVYPRVLDKNNTMLIIPCDSGASECVNAVDFYVPHSGAGLDVITSDNSIALNQWNHVAVTWDGGTNAANVHIYINGTEASYRTKASASGTRQSDATSNQRIGDNGSGTRAFDGLIDDVRIYNKTLTSTEVQSVYNEGIVPTPTPTPTTTPTPASITVLSPNGGEQWQQGTTQTIKWLPAPVPTQVPCPLGASCPEMGPWPVDIYLVTAQVCPTGADCALMPELPTLIASSVSDNGSYNWTVNASAGNYRIKIVRGSTSDQSDAPFSIVAPTPTPTPTPIVTPTPTSTPTPPPSDNILGYNTIGALTDNADSNYLNAFRYTMLGTSGTASSISAYIASPIGTSPNNKYQMAIYSDAGGLPGSLIASTASGTIVPNSWNTLSISATLNANTAYWLVYNTNGASNTQNNIKYDAGTTGQMQYKAQTFGTWPNVFGTSGGSLAGKGSIYVAFSGTSLPPTVSLSASPSSITSGQSSTLTWSSTDATSCIASGGWTGIKSISGTQSVSPTSNTTYTLTCTGAGGTATQSATVTVNIPSTNLCESRKNELQSSSGWLLLGPNDGRINTIEKFGDGILYVGTNSGGVFRSLDNGNTWQSFSIGLDSSNINQLRTINGKLYSATGDGIYVLQDSIWKSVFNPSPSGILFIDYSSLTKKFWALGHNRLFVSDNGESWNEINTFPSQVSLSSSLLVSRKGQIYTTGFDGLYQSDDSGASWKKIFDFVLSMTEDEDGNLYVRGLTNPKLYKKNYGETNFKELGYLQVPKSELNEIVYSEGLIFAEDVMPLVSKDGGYTFTQIYPQNANYWDIRQIYPLGSGIIILANDNGVSEVDINKNLAKKYGQIKGYSEITSVAVSDKAELLLTTYWDHGGLASQDCGIEWQGLSANEGNAYSIDPINYSLYLQYLKFGFGFNDIRLFSLNDPQPIWTGDYQIIGGDVAFDTSQTPTRVYAIHQKIIDDGKGTVIKKENRLLSFNMVSDLNLLNIKETNLTFQYPSKIAIDSKTEFRMIILADNKLYESVDKGITWNELANLNSNGFDISINPFNKDEIFIAGPAGSVFRVINRSVTTILLPFETKNKPNDVNTIAYDNNMPNLIYAGSQQGFFFSTDNGNTWTEYTKGLYSKDVRKIIPKGDKIFIGTWGSGNAVILKENLFTPTPTSSSPIAWYKFDGNANDSSGNGNTGTLMNGPTFTTGEIGQALSFDGVNDYVDTGSPSIFDDLGPVTYSAWIFARSRGNSVYPRVLDKNNTMLIIPCDSGASECVNAVDFYVPHSGAGLDVITTDNSIALNKWNHVAVTWDGGTNAANVHIYINGTEASYRTRASASGTRHSDAASNQRIGDNGSGTRAFDGLIDDVRIYNKTLTSTEVKSVYNEWIVPTPSQ